jgi:hypothetical protein
MMARTKEQIRKITAETEQKTLRIAASASISREDPFGDARRSNVHIGRLPGSARWPVRCDSRLASPVSSARGREEIDADAAVELAADAADRRFVADVGRPESAAGELPADAAPVRSRGRFCPFAESARRPLCACWPFRRRRRCS